MELARRYGGRIVVATAVAIGAVVWLSVPRAPARAQAAELGAGAAWASITGVVEASALDPAHWSVRAVPLRYEPVPRIVRTALEPDGRFVLNGLSAGDYRVELVSTAEPLVVLASADHVRPGGEELVLALDPLRRVRAVTLGSTE